MRTLFVCTCVALSLAGVTSAQTGRQVPVRDRVIHYSQMMIKLDGTVVSTHDNGATWTWTVPPLKELTAPVAPMPIADVETVIVSDVLGNIMFQGSEDDWRRRRHDPTLSGALLVVTKRPNGVSTTERILRTK